MPNLPSHVKYILEILEQAGHGAYLVGGPVRDFVMGITPKDWDIATSATPEVVQTLFPRTIPTGIRHGTVTVLVAGDSVEVTTFRQDGAYLDHRRPEQVAYVTRLEDDLARRDFTMNAMALDLRGKRTDPFGGQKDIIAKCIRTVGDPAARFAEDALRLFRALRFSAQLGFAIDADTRAAMTETWGRARTLSAERVRDEVEKVLLSPRPGVMEDVLALGLLSSYVGPLAKDTVPFVQLSALSATSISRWAGAAAILAEAGAIADPVVFLQTLRHSNTTSTIAGTAGTLASALPTDPIALKRLLSRYGSAPVSVAAQVAPLFGNQASSYVLEQIFSSGEPYCVEQLAITGGDLLTIGFTPGPNIGAALSALLEQVIVESSLNQREELLALAKEFLQENTR
ncbi:MAG: CCA tRNA nucleotidyltransferase [Oscillospiraceae bacterium]|nr:CCA tRNA nucleotidyltransferase [Oscillospiraceae bacterium]